MEDSGVSRCQQAGPKVVADRVPSQDALATGARQRLSPTGASA